MAEGRGGGPREPALPALNKRGHKENALCAFYVAWPGLMAWENQARPPLCHRTPQGAGGQAQKLGQEMRAGAMYPGRSWAALRYFCASIPISASTIAPIY